MEYVNVCLRYATGEGFTERDSSGLGRGDEDELRSNGICGENGGSVYSECWGNSTHSMGGH
jgi:hypothetical protein